MFISNVRELMNKKKKTIREVAAETNMSVSTVHRATQDAGEDRGRSRREDETPV